MNKNRVTAVLAAVALFALGGLVGNLTAPEPPAPVVEPRENLPLEWTGWETHLLECAHSYPGSEYAIVTYTHRAKSIDFDVECYGTGERDE